MQIGSLTVRSRRSLDTLISFGALRSFQLHPLVWGVSGWSGWASCHRSTDISIRSIRHRITVWVGGVLHMKELWCTGNALRSGRTCFTFRTCRTCCTLIPFITLVARFSLRGIFQPICRGFTRFLNCFIRNTYPCATIVNNFVIIPICARYPRTLKGGYWDFCNAIIRQLFDSSGHINITKVCRMSGHINAE